MRAGSETFMPLVIEQCEQRKGNFYSLQVAAEGSQVEGIHKSKVFTSDTGSFCHAYYFRLPDCLLSCIDILTLQK